MWWSKKETLTDQELGEALGLSEFIFNNNKRMSCIRFGIKGLKEDILDNEHLANSQLVLCAILETKGFLSSYPGRVLKLEKEFWNRL